MKKFLLCALCALCVTGVSAQDKTLAQTEAMRLSTGQKTGELLLEVGGYGITFGQGSFSQNLRSANDSKSPRSVKPVRFGIGFGRMELGFSMLTTPDYKGYSPQEGDFMDLRVGKSTHFGFRFLNLSVALNRQRNLFFNTGIHLMCDNYTFSDNITLQKLDGRIVPVPLDRDYKKSKLATSSLGIPLQLTFIPARKLYVSALVYGDVVYNSHTKVKKPISKARLSGVNEWQCGAGATISYRGFGLYFKYGFTPLFRSGVGPKVHPLTVGLYFGR